MRISDWSSDVGSSERLAAQGGDTLCFALRPATAAQQASPAPLRLALAPVPGGLSIHILKRRGPACAEPLNIVFEPASPPASVPARHAPMDRPLPALPAHGRRRSEEPRGGEEGVKTFKIWGS